MTKRGRRRRGPGGGRGPRGPGGGGRTGRGTGRRSPSRRPSEGLLGGRRSWQIAAALVVLAVAFAGYRLATGGRATTESGAGLDGSGPAATAGAASVTGGGAESGASSGAPTPGRVPVYGYEVVATYPHDPAAFTQGLVYLDGVLYEGTGLYGESTLRKVDLATGRVLQTVDVPADYFGEGIAVWDDRIMQLTWRSRTGFVYDLATFKRQSQFSYATEGWGITHDGTRLIMSDGTAALRFWDPETLDEIGRVEVTSDGEPVRNLNELEYVNGEVLANVWQTDQIVAIDPDSGAVRITVDLTGLLPAEDRAPGTDVLNGIAYDQAGDRLFVTGKKWPKLFEIRLVPEQVSMGLLPAVFMPGQGS